MRVLLVEDSAYLQRSIGAGLRSSGYAVDITGDGEEGLWYAQKHEYDAIVLDLMLPRLDGLSVLRRLRDSGRRTHVLLLTARDSVEDRVKGLRAGADDYLVKPFAFDELLARIESLSRRAHGIKTPIVQFGELTLDMSSYTAQRGETELDLPRREFALLQYLMMRRGELVTRADIEAHIYNDAMEITSNAVESAICALRRKIDPREGRSLIRTRRGLGYIFGAEGLS